ncbi:MAG: enoyl-CoA hydratase/isomerase family protein [Deltaproteobacteria bacterium]|nr:enoyl-CoA hydratase/isomerase family protein [Deltaproteobacteria bacterium]
MSEELFVTLSVEAPAGIITINRPKALNALNPQVLDQLEACLRQAASDPAVAGVIITGAGGKAFVAGADIGTMAHMAPEEGLAFAEKGLAVLALIENIPKPVLAAVDGYALGGGCELALACDMIYASEGSSFGQPEVNLGIIPGFGGTQRLARLVGRNLAKEICFSGNMYTAQRAKEMGLVQEVLPKEGLLPHCLQLVRTIAKKGPLAVAQAKRAINQGVDLSLSAGLWVEKLAFMSLFGSKDQVEGMTAFIEKRKPEFRGR